ncbi:neuroligin-3-like [Pollicipes pollicipes]|uniref:neuroligin-3-like n=1 Tax=Pollicipes pollicipes TaxID=41117 RepID=UPI0018858D07|nr:neuroligin-3-like [Pollicipes pollicipes]
MRRVSEVDQVSSNVREKFAVMFYIHGGEFTHGASNLFPAHLLSAWGEVVVVTFNYRLGALGFLSTADEYSPGNYGMLDQAMALRWVYENVHYFNGDRQRITVFGPGAGAASAGLLAVSPKTAHMVHQLIGESGSALAEWAAIYDEYRVQNTSRIFGDKIGCISDSSYKLLNCLNKGRSAIEIGNVEFKPDVGTFPWAPFVETNVTFPGNDWYEEWHQEDWRFLPDFPERLFRRREFRQGLSVLTGANRDEAAFFVYGNRSLAPDFVVTQRMLDDKIHEWVKQYNYTLNPDGVYDAIRYMYTYWPDPHNRTWIREMYIDFLSDALYKAPVDSMVKLMVELGVTTYQYVLNTTVEALKAPLWREVPHDLEYYFLTGAPFMDPEFFAEDIRIGRQIWTEGDRNMSQLFMETFSNFAKYGRPTPRQIFDLVNWQPALAGDLRYLSINNTFNSTIFSNYRQTELSFWSQYLPTVVGHLVPTYRPSTEFWWEPREPLQIAFWSVTSLAFLLLVIVGICCCLWQGAKKKTDQFYEESFMEDHFEVRENSHFAAKPSKPPSVASLSGGAAAAEPARADARSVARDIQMDRRRRSDSGRQVTGSVQQEACREPLVREPPPRVPSSQAQSVTELEPLRGSQATRLDPRRSGGVAVLPAAGGERVQPQRQPRPKEAFAPVPHAKSIPNMVEYEERPPTRIRPKSTEALDRDDESTSSRPGTPKVPHFQFVEPYDVVQLPNDYQYNSNPNLAAPDRTTP